MNLTDLRQIAKRATDDCDCDPIIQHSDTCLYWTGQVDFDNTFSPEFILLILDTLAAARTLANNVQGLLSISEVAIRQDAGNTNYQCSRESCDRTISALEALTKHMDEK